MVRAGQVSPDSDWQYNFGAAQPLQPSTTGGCGWVARTQAAACAARTPSDLRCPVGCAHTRSRTRRREVASGPAHGGVSVIAAAACSLFDIKTTPSKPDINDEPSEWRGSEPTSERTQAPTTASAGRRPRPGSWSSGRGQDAEDLPLPVLKTPITGPGNLGTCRTLPAAYASLARRSVCCLCSSICSRARESFCRVRVRENKR